MAETARITPGDPHRASPGAPHSPLPASAEAPSRRERAPRCRTCEVRMRFAGGVSTHDRWAERFVCPSCGAETYRGYGRGSV